MANNSYFVRQDTVVASYYAFNYCVKVSGRNWMHNRSKVRWPEQRLPANSWLTRMFFDL